MKKIFYILAVVLVALTACSKEIESPSTGQDDPVVVENGPMAVLTFNAVFPDTQIPTRAAMGDVAVIDNMYVAVFGISSNVNGGTLLHWAPAKLTPQSDDESHTYTAKYEVTLPLSTEGRVVVFVANYTSDTPPTFDREKQVLAGLYTEDGNCAYWQRVTLQDGIKGVDNGDGTYNLDPDTEYLLSDIHLVRNFAKITLEPALETSEFTISGYTLINKPDKGSLAPMNNNSFETLYTSIGEYCDAPANSEDNFFDALMTAKYTGFMPANADIDTSDPGESSMIVPASNTGFYMYERTVPTQVNTQTAVICKLTWKEDSWFATNKPESPNRHLAGETYYYKIELMGSTGEYVPVCRNIWYKININGLEGDGEQTYAQAFSGAYFGNVSASIETSTLNEITDNISTLTVNMMEWTEINDNAVIDVYFNYEPVEGESYTSVDNTNVSVTIREITGYNQSIYNWEEADSPTSGAYMGWGHLKVTLKEVPTSGMLRGVLRVQGNKEGKRAIFRDIVFTLMGKADFKTTSSDITVSDDDNYVTINVKLPEKLGYSVFPIHVKIEAKNNNLTTTSSDLPVKFGPSAFNSGKNSYYFVKTIMYSDYYHKNSSGEWVYTTEFPCTLKKTNNQDVIVKLSADYFNTTGELTAQ